MKLKLFGFLTYLFFSVLAVSAQDGTYTDTVFLKDQITIPCKILEQSYQKLKILYRDSVVTTISTDNIVDYKFGDIKSFRKEQKLKFADFENNTVFFEGLGNGMFGSLNYDRIFYRKNIFSASFRIGFAMFETGGLLPMELNLFWTGKKPAFHTELGFGYTPLVWADYNMMLAFLRFGFRYQQPKGGLFFRVAFTPLYQFEYNYIDSYSGNTGFDGGFFLPWMGFSVGYTIER